MANFSRLTIHIDEIECPFCGAECDDERISDYTSISDYTRITCDKCQGVFELYVCVDPDIEITKIQEPPPKPDYSDPLETGLPDVIGPNQITLFNEESTKEH